MLEGVFKVVFGKFKVDEGRILPLSFDGGDGILPLRVDLLELEVEIVHDVECFLGQVRVVPPRRVLEVQQFLLPSGPLVA